MELNQQVASNNATFINQGVYNHNQSEEKVTNHPFSVPTVASNFLAELSKLPNGVSVTDNSVNDEVLAVLMQYNLVEITQTGNIVVSKKGLTALKNKIAVVYPLDSGVDSNGNTRTVTVTGYNLSLLSMSSGSATAFIKALSATATTFFSKITNSNLLNVFVNSLKLSNVFKRLNDITVISSIRSELDDSLTNYFVENPDVNFIESEIVRIHSLINSIVVKKLGELTLNNKLSLPKVSLFGNSYVYTTAIEFNSSNSTLYLEYKNEEAEIKQIEFDTLDLNFKSSILQIILENN